MDNAKMIEVFESVGLDGEFGRVASRLGVTDRGLFWSAYVRDVETLALALGSGLAELFADPETLAPRLGNTMVEDTAYGIALPTNIPMVQGASGWRIDRNASFPEIYQSEFKKTQYLRDKFFAELMQAKKIFVFKQNSGASSAQCRLLHSTLRKFGPIRLMAVDLANAWHPPGTIDLLEDGLYRGYLARFAPEDLVEDIDLAGWTELLQNMLLVVGEPVEAPAPAEVAGERFRRVEAVHPHWVGALKLSLTDDTVLHEHHDSRGKYTLAAGDLMVFWDHFAPDHFIADATGIFVHETLRRPGTQALVERPPETAGPGTSIYDGASMADPPEEEGLVAVLEAPARIPMQMPAFVADLSGRGLGLNAGPWQDIHGSYLVRREDALLFGPNHLVGPAGTWSCETRAFKERTLGYFQPESYDHIFPGVKPQLIEKVKRGLRTAHIPPADVTLLEMPVFLATPLEPVAWGRWIATVAHKVAQFRQYGQARQFLCYAALDWQNAFLQELGLQAHEILRHDPGRTYICRDVMTVEYSAANMTVSRLERANFFEIVSRLRLKIPPRPRLLLTRPTHSRNNPNHPVLQNEAALAAMLAERGFEWVEPSSLAFAELVSLFAAAREVVCVGGSGLFNTVFCAPGTRVVTIEATADDIADHAGLLASLGLEYGVIFGEQDLSDPAPNRKRWALDLPRAAAALDGFFAGG